MVLYIIRPVVDPNNTFDGKSRVHLKGTSLLKASLFSQEKELKLNTENRGLCLMVPY